MFFEGEFLEEALLVSPDQLQSDGKTNSLSYVPSRGWETGLYTFQLEMHNGEKLIQSTEQSQLTVTPESITKVVSWKTMGVVISSTVLLIVITVSLVLYRRRDMLRDNTE